ncbi:MAG: hypothetical protein ACTHU1_00215 [Arachnia sp.]
MTQLLKAELLRLVSRRLLIILLLGMAAMSAIGSAALADEVRPLNATDRMNAQSSFDSETQYWEEECGPGEGLTTGTCDEWFRPTDVEDHMRTPIGFGEFAQGTIEFGQGVVLLAVAVMAASLVGAEFASGNVGTQLLFTPRRSSLLLAKVVAGVVGGLLLAVTFLITSLVFSAIMFLSLRGALDMTAGIELPMALGRTLVLVLLIATMGGSLAMAFGSTLIPSGVFAVTLLGSFTLADTVEYRSLLQPFLPTNILLAMIDGQTKIVDYDAMNFSEDVVIAHLITYDWALGYSVVGTALILLGSLWWFRRRDIVA